MSWKTSIDVDDIIELKQQKKKYPFTVNVLHPTLSAVKYNKKTTWSGKSRFMISNLETI